MTRKTIEVPRYLVRLPEGEVELDAREIVRRHGRGEVNFSTMVARLPGGEFHRLDEDGDFKPILWKLLNIRRLSE
ncbi:MAG: hypothetical protein IJJ28_04615 [Lentisphaeria bacterium]|nr:hypothetical protein [Lentisphaeria bacterium]